MIQNYAPEEFTDEETSRLSPFVSNLDRPVYLIWNLPPFIAGAVFAKQSYSPKSPRRILLEEILDVPESSIQAVVQNQLGQGVPLEAAIDRACGFFERVAGIKRHGTVLELGGAHLVIEGLSNIATKAFEDHRLTSPLERSTRHVDFSKKINNEYQYYKEPVLMASEFAEDYVRLMSLLFDTYAKILPKMIEFVEKRMPFAEFVYEDPNTGQRTLVEAIPESDDRLRRSAKAQHRSIVKGKACDLTRGLLPASAQTSMGIFINGLSASYMIDDFNAHPLTEMRDFAPLLEGELKKYIAPLIRSVVRPDYLRGIREGMNDVTGRVLTADFDFTHSKGQSVTLVDYDTDIDVKLISQMLYPYSNKSLPKIMEEVRRMDDAKRYEIIKTFMGERQNRFDKPGRALEYSYFLWDIVAPFSVYRDLERQRMLSQQSQPLSTELGHHMPPEIEEAGFKEEYVKCMEAAQKFWEAASKKHPLEAQYAVPFAFNKRWNIYENFREGTHLEELRSSPHGDTPYRKVAQDMYTQRCRVAPMFMEFVRFVNQKTYGIGDHIREVREEMLRRGLTE